MMGRRRGKRVGPYYAMILRDTPLGQALSDARREADLTQRELAEKSRVSLRAIKGIEGGTNRRHGRRVLYKLTAILPDLIERSEAIAAKREGSGKGAKRRRPQKVQRGSRLHH
jgi:transcriptional regulator with XRE-family HTH domain